MAEKARKILKFIWKIENFSYCSQEENDFLKSPEFYVYASEGSFWCLQLHPKRNFSDKKYLSVFLQRQSSLEELVEIKIDFEIAVLKSNGETEFAREMKDRCFRKGWKLGFDNLVARERIDPKSSILLPKDVLTVQCCICPKNTELETYTEVIGKTCIEVERYRRLWKIIDYTALDSIIFNGRELTLDLMESSEYNNEGQVLKCTFYDASDLKVFHCKIGVLDSNNSVVKFLINQFLDIERAAEYTEDELNFNLITEAELLKERSVYLPNGQLKLDCELVFGEGKHHSQIERITCDATFGIWSTVKRASTSEIEVSTKKFLYCIENPRSSLQNDFQSLWREGTLSDFTIKVGDKCFQVHKSVMCARSPVFKSMLTSNMKESENNMVEISDFEEDIVQRMVTFMYSDRTSNLDWDTAKKLYVASDKYCLITLKRICSEVLKQDLAPSNIKEVLTLADMHGDDYLWKIILEFICDNETEVICSTEWKTFLQEDLPLAAETMYQIFMKKAELDHGNSH